MNRIGNTLFVIDRARYELALAQLDAAVTAGEAQLTQAERESKRNRQLGNLATTEQSEEINAKVLDLRAQLDGAKVARATAKLNLDRTVVRGGRKMPLYAVLTQIGALDEPARTKLAADLTDLHSEYASVPKNWVHIIFQEYSAGNGYTAGQPASVASLTLLIRTGRPAEYKRELLIRLWKLLQLATGAPDDQIVIGIQEVPASQAMEMGKVMPEVRLDN